MIREFRLPDLGEGLTDAEIVGWRVGTGDRVELNQVVADVETAKAAVELPAPYAGVITRLHGEPGTVVRVGEPLISFDVPDDAAAETAAEPPPEPAAGERLPALVGYGAEEDSAERPRRRPRVLPGARTPARESPAREREVRIPVDGVRRRTADAMVSSAFTAPHATVFLTVDVTPTMDLLRRLRSTPDFTDCPLTPLAFAARAVCLAIPRQPMVNARWDGSGADIVQQNFVNLGVAVATPRGLLVPNVRDADRLALPHLAAAIGQMAERARHGSITPAELSSGTFTLTNVGVFGVDAGTPIINPGEAAILALGAVRVLPWVHRDAVSLREVMTLSLSFDHRLVDGEQGARFLADVGGILAEPEMVLARY